MCILLGHNPQISFVTFFCKMNLVIFRPKLKDNRYLKLCTVLADSFETLQVIRSWSEDVHIVEDITSQIIFCHFFFTKRTYVTFAAIIKRY